MLFIIVACCFLLPLGLAGFTKLVFFKHRPVPMELGNRRKKLMAGSFPSGYLDVVSSCFLGESVFYSCFLFLWSDGGVGYDF